MRTVESQVKLCIKRGSTNGEWPIRAAAVGVKVEEVVNELVYTESLNTQTEIATFQLAQ